MPNLPRKGNQNELFNHVYMLHDFPSVSRQRYDIPLDTLLLPLILTFLQNHYDAN